MKANYSIIQLLSVMSFVFFKTVEAGIPVWSFTALTTTTLSVSSGETANVQYQITNKSSKKHILSMQSISGITQLTTGSGVCKNPFTLSGNDSCTLSLRINGSQLNRSISDGPIVCEQESILQCYGPAPANILHITKTGTNPTAIGQPAQGGIIACKNGGLNNLIAAVSDNSSNIRWGTNGVDLIPAASSTTDGATNTAAIVNCYSNSSSAPCPGNLTASTYAAGICSTYEVDSQGNTPCQTGTCYNDWFLPSGDNTTATGQLNCLYTNQALIQGFDRLAYYWSSTVGNPNNAYVQRFVSGNSGIANRITLHPVRCVRIYTP